MKRLAALRSLEGHDRHAFEHDRVEALGQREVIRRAQRPLAELAEAEPGDALRGTLHDQFPALHGERDGMRLAAAGEAAKSFAEPRMALVADRHVPDLRALELFHAVVGARVELDDVHALLQQRDERQEQGPVEAALVEPVGLHVGCGDHGDTSREQRGEEPPQDHRIGDIGHRELVEAQQRRLARECGGDGRDRIGVLDLALLHALPVGVDALVHVGHEGVKMGAALLRDRDGLDEEIHQHRLAAPDGAPDVEAARRRRGGAAAEEPAERALLVGQAALGQHAGEFAEPAHDVLLRGIVLDGALRDERAIALGEGGWHGRKLSGGKGGRVALARTRPGGNADNRRMVCNVP